MLGLQRLMPKPTRRLFTTCSKHWNLRMLNRKARSLLTMVWESIIANSNAIDQAAADFSTQPEPTSADHHNYSLLMKGLVYANNRLR